MEVVIRKYDVLTKSCEGIVPSLDFGTCQSGYPGKLMVFDLAVSGVRSSSVSIKLRFASSDTEVTVPNSGEMCDTGLFGIKILDQIDEAVEIDEFFCGVGSEIQVPMRNGFVSKYIHMVAVPKIPDGSTSSSFDVVVEYEGGDPAYTGSSSSSSMSSSSSSNNPQSLSFSSSSHLREVQCSFCEDELSSEYYLSFSGGSGAGSCSSCLDCTDLYGSAHRFERLSPCLYVDTGSLHGSGFMTMSEGRWWITVQCMGDVCVEFVSPYLTDCHPAGLVYSKVVHAGGCDVNTLSVGLTP